MGSIDDVEVMGSIDDVEVIDSIDDVEVISNVVVSIAKDKAIVDGDM